MRRPPRYRRRRARSLNWRWGALAVITALVIALIVVLILDYGPRLFRAAPAAIGQTAPAFTLDSSSGQRFDLSDYIGRKAVLLVFYGGYQCTTCRIQLAALRREIAERRALEAVVALIGEDAVIDAKRLEAELGHQLVVLSDRTRWVARRYGMFDPDRRFAASGYIIIDRSGEVRTRRIDPLFGDHAGEILNALEEAARATRR